MVEEEGNARRSARSPQQEGALEAVACALNRGEPDPSIPNGPMRAYEASGRRRPLHPIVVAAGSQRAAEMGAAHPGMTVDVTGAVQAAELQDWLDEPRPAEGALVGHNELLLSLVNPTCLGGQLVLSYAPAGDADGEQGRAESIAAEVFARACSWALDASVHRDSPLVPALATGKPVLAHVFAGRDRGLAGLEAKIDKHGKGRIAVAAFDKRRDPVHGNLNRQEVKAGLRAAARVRWVVDVYSGTPCESFTVLRFNPPRPGQQECPPLRKRSWLPGVPPIPEGWEDYFAMHEAFVEFTFDLGDDVLAWPGGRFVAEGPIDRGDELGRPQFFRPEWAEHVPLEKHPRAVRFIQEHKAVVQDMCQCMSGAACQKATSLISDKETGTAYAGASVQCIPCVHEDGTHAEQAYGEDENGESRSARSAEYPEGMCDWLAVGLCGGSRDEVYAAALAAAQTALRAVGAAVAERHGLRILEEGDAAAAAAASPPLTISIPPSPPSAWDALEALGVHVSAQPAVCQVCMLPWTGSCACGKTKMCDRCPASPVYCCETETGGGGPVPPAAAAADGGEAAPSVSVRFGDG